MIGWRTWLSALELSRSYERDASTATDPRVREWLLAASTKWSATAAQMAAMGAVVRMIRGAK